MIMINGEEKNIDSQSLGDYLRSNNYNLMRIAVEINGEIAPKTKYDEIFIKNGDKIEIVSFVGGG